MEKSQRESHQSWVDAKRIIANAIIEFWSADQTRADSFAAAMLARMAHENLLVVHVDEVTFNADDESA